MESEAKVENEVKMEGETNKEETVEDAADAEYESDEETEEGKDPKTEAARLTADLMRNPQVLAAFNAKLGGMVGRKSGYVETLPKSVRRRIKALKKLQAAMFEVESKFFEEVHNLECKFAEKQKPFSDKRDDIVNSRLEPTDSDCDWPSDEDEEDEGAPLPKAKIVEIDETKPESEQNGDSSDDKTTGIPEFWLTIFKNVDILNSLIQEHDEPILRHLTDVRVKHHPAENMGFRLEFIFEENEYFTGTVLTKEYTMSSKPDPEAPLQYQGPEINESKGCKIDWKPNKDVTVRKQKKKVKGTKKTVSKHVKVESFFNFFSPPEVKEENEDDEDADERREQLMTDFEIGQMLRERIVPRAVLYFTGEALSDDEDEDEDEEYDEDGDEDDDEDPDYVPPANGAGPPECKQQ